MWQTDEEVTNDLKLISDFPVSAPKPSQKEIEKKSTKVYRSIYEDDVDDTASKDDDEPISFEEHQARIVEEIRGVSWHKRYI